MMEPLELSETREIFSRHSIRCTRQREEIYGALRATNAHPTAEELFQRVRREQPGMSLATVYNTLHVFTRHGHCRRLSAPAGAGGGGAACRYDADLSDHLHLVTPDGRVRDLPADLGREVLRHIPRDLVRRVEEAMGTRVQRLNVDFIAAPPGEGSDGGDDGRAGDEAGGE
jgi:Fur family peroxide stress response transcriptional regulator